ncbi:hypothetical protein I4F81_001113 [Pyropia yezoensis]|uniref:Uncharacterized protein n=1 Tax=Pyropia yezoensis TaxID=2788 RepID=A0ACC3BKR8_PYRYE|nr:hypothetical protein I4F81_001113 [Neopyropia yezoensis]
MLWRRRRGPGRSRQWLQGGPAPRGSLGRSRSDGHGQRRWRWRRRRRWWWWWRRRAWRRGGFAAQGTGGRRGARRGGGHPRHAQDIATKGRCCCAVGLHGPGYWAKHCGTSGGGLRSEGAFWCPSCFTRERVREHAGGVHQSRSGPPLWDNRQQRHCDASGRKGGWGVRKAGAPTEAPRRGHVSASTCRDDIQLTTAHAL